MSTSNAAMVLGEFGNKIGQPQLGFKNERLCTLSFDDIITHLELSENSSFLSCYLWIADITPERRNEIALEIADANYLLARTHGATFGMNRHSGDLVLAARLPDATLTLAIFEQSLENLVNLAQAWQEKIARGPVPEPAETPIAPSPMTSDNGFSFRV